YTTAIRGDRSCWRWRSDSRRRGSCSAAMAPVIVRLWFTPRWATDHPAEVERAQGWVSATSADAYRACCEAIAAWNHRPRLADITAPTLVIAGAHDVATPVDPDARLLVDAIPNARLEVLDAAHLATMETPEVATESIRVHVAG